MPALSTIIAFTNFATANNGDTIDADTHFNTPWTDGKTYFDDYLSVMKDLEKNYASGTVPTDKPEGKIFADTSNDPAQLKFYKDGSANLYTLASLEAANAFTGNNTFTGTTSLDTISEKTADTGVTVDSVKMQDGKVFADSNKNSAINGACIVGQRAAVTLGAGHVGIANRVYGTVDRIAGFTTTTATAGTFGQSSAAPIGDAGFSAVFSNVSMPAGGKLHWLYRMEARDGAQHKGQKISISAWIHHDVGSAKNATITVRDPDVADVFSATTEIGNNGGESVATGVGFLLKFEGLDLSAFNPERGLEFEIELDTGTIVTKTAHLTHFKVEPGEKATPLIPVKYVTERLWCWRYAEPLGYGINGLAFSTTEWVGGVVFRVIKRAVPTLTLLKSGVADFRITDSVVDEDPTSVSATLTSAAADGMRFSSVNYVGLSSLQPYIMTGSGETMLAESEL